MNFSMTMMSKATLSPGADARGREKHVRPSNRDLRVLAFIERFKREKGYAPKLVEIQAACGFGCLGSTCRSLRTLQRHGYIYRPKYQNQIIVLMEGVKVG
jgi:hypothetical protein